MRVRSRRPGAGACDAPALASDELADPAALAHAAAAQTTAHAAVRAIRWRSSIGNIWPPRGGVLARIVRFSPIEVRPCNVNGVPGWRKPPSAESNVCMSPPTNRVAVGPERQRTACDLPLRISMACDGARQITRYS